MSKLGSCYGTDWGEGVENVMLSFCDERIMQRVGRFYLGSLLPRVQAKAVGNRSGAMDRNLYAGRMVNRSRG